MLKRETFNVLAVLLVAVFMMAGCAKQELVKKDEAIVSLPTAKQAEQSKTGNSSVKPATTGSVAPPAATYAPPLQLKDPSIAKLQSALEKIYFDFDSAGLSEAARSTLANNSTALMKESSVKIRIEGNCDERGSAEYNLALGERRAKAAKQYLVTLGVASGRLSTISYGKEKPASQGDDESAWRKNRRDEFVVVTE